MNVSFYKIHDSYSRDKRIHYDIKSRVDGQTWSFSLHAESAYKLEDKQVLSKAGLLPQKSLKETLIEKNKSQNYFTVLMSEICTKTFKTRKEMIDVIQEAYTHSKISPPDKEVALENYYYVKDLDCVYYVFKNDNNPCDKAWEIRISDGYDYGKHREIFAENFENLKFSNRQEAGETLYYIYSSL